jgi:outer membrane immunogenic protein
MTKSLLLGAVALAIYSTSALAADLPSRAAPPLYVEPPAFTWTGIYAGANAGYAFNGHQSDTITANDAIAAPGLAGGFVAPYTSNHDSGFTGGLQIGYNYEFEHAFGTGGLVVGVETDAAYTGLSNESDTFGTAGDDTRFRSRLDYVGTLRGRLGYAFGNFLVYGTGGLAYGGVTNSTSISAAGATIYSGSQDQIHAGYAYGGGVEYALPVDSFVNFFHTSAVSIKAEYIHYNLGTSSYYVPATIAASSFTSRVHDDGDLVRLGINFKLGAPPAAPVVARY